MDRIGAKTISDSKDGGSWGYGGEAIGVTIGRVQYLMVGGVRGEAGLPIGTDGSGGEWQRIDRRAISDGAHEVDTGAATETVTVTEIEETTMTEGEWEDPRTTQGLGQDQGRDHPGAVAGRGRGVPPPW